MLGPDVLFNYIFTYLLTFLFMRFKILQYLDLTLMTFLYYINVSLCHLTSEPSDHFSSLLLTEKKHSLNKTDYFLKKCRD